MPSARQPDLFVVDGSNIATEGRSQPSLEQLNEAVLAFMDENPDVSITVVVDATFGHRIDKKEVEGVRRSGRQQRTRDAPAGRDRTRRRVRAVDRQQGQCRRALQRLLPGVPRRVRLAVRRGSPHRWQAGAARRLGVRRPDAGPGPEEPPGGPEAKQSDTADRPTPSRRPTDASEPKKSTPTNRTADRGRPADADVERCDRDAGSGRSSGRAPSSDGRSRRRPRPRRTTRRAVGCVVGAGSRPRQRSDAVPRVRRAPPGRHELHRAWSRATPRTARTPDRRRAGLHPAAVDGRTRAAQRPLGARRSVRRSPSSSSASRPTAGASTPRCRHGRRARSPSGRRCAAAPKDSSGTPRRRSADAVERVRRAEAPTRRRLRQEDAGEEGVRRAARRRRPRRRRRRRPPPRRRPAKKAPGQEGGGEEGARPRRRRDEDACQEGSGEAGTGEEDGGEEGSGQEGAGQEGAGEEGARQEDAREADAGQEGASDAPAADAGRHLEHQLAARPPGAGGGVDRRGAARRAVSPGDQARRRCLPGADVRGARLRVGALRPGQWNGVAILSKVGIDDVVANFADGIEPDPDARIITATCGGIRVSCCYVPNGRSLDDDHYTYKLSWLDRLLDISVGTPMPART